MSTKDLQPKDQSISEERINHMKEESNSKNFISQWWDEFSLRAKLLAIATLVVSLLMTGVTFFALSSIQKDAGMNDTRYARDLGLLLSGNVTELVANDQERELFNVAEKFGVQVEI